MTIGILLQGPISTWTEKIITYYAKTFPNAEILLSTWDSENIPKNLPCEFILVTPPPMPDNHYSTVNHQIVGTCAGLEYMNSDIIMKCRTDQFIRNTKIFEVFEKFCPRSKIMIPDYLTLDSIDYFASDLCQIATKDVLNHYWNSIKLYDGTFHLHHPEIFLTANYIIRGKSDTNPWKECLRKYFYVKRFYEDFQIEWEKMDDPMKPDYKKYFSYFYPQLVKPDP